VVIIVLLIGGAAAIGGWWLGGRWTSTPTVVGTSQQDAVDAVRNAGLVPALSTAHDNATPSGEIAAVDPHAGTRQLHGATVTLVVSNGRPVVPPIAAGTSVSAARTLVRAADLTPVTDAKRDVYSNTVSAGTVVRTDPKAGEDARIGARVLLVRSSGPVPEEVPTVAGKEPEDARNKLLVAGFTIGPASTTFDPHARPGSVVGTDPPAGSTAPHGSPVSLVLAVSKTVPNVAGSTVDQARGELQREGFHVTVGDPLFDPSKPAGTVVRTDPPSGTRVDPADPEVTLIASNAVTVPPVTGLAVQQAEQALTDLGLDYQVYSLFGDAGSTVTSQYPHAGTRVEPGSLVELSAWA
jgi:serine/threonine-protein kinase